MDITAVIGITSNSEPSIKVLNDAVIKRIETTNNVDLIIPLFNLYILIIATRSIKERSIGAI